MVFTEGKGDDGEAAAKLPEELAGPFRALQGVARRIAEVSADCKIEGMTSSSSSSSSAAPAAGAGAGGAAGAAASSSTGISGVDEYVASFKPDMMPLVSAWIKGAKFVEIMAMTNLFEGSIIRVIRRLEELCRQLGDAAKAIGDDSLEKKFKEASAKMRRDIIFAASLYL